MKVLRLFPDCCSEKVQSLKVRPYQWNRMVICSYSSNKHPNDSHNWLISVPTQNEKFSLKQLCLHSKNNSPHMKVFVYPMTQLTRGKQTSGFLSSTSSEPVLWINSVDLFSVDSSKLARLSSLSVTMAPGIHMAKFTSSY